MKRFSFSISQLLGLKDSGKENEDANRGKKNSAECSSVDPVFSRKRRRVSKIGIDGGGEIVPSSSPSSSSSDYEAGVSNQDGLEILGTVDVGAGTSREGSSSGSNNTPPRPLSAIQPTVESELKAVPELPVTAEKKAKRARTSFTRTQLQVLEFYFLTCPYPDTTARSQIAKTANIDENTVQVWFQNRRARYRKREQPHQPLQRPLMPMTAGHMDALHNYIMHAIANPGHFNPYYQGFMPFPRYPMPFPYPMGYFPHTYHQQMVQKPQEQENQDEEVDVEAEQAEPATAESPVNQTTPTTISEDGPLDAGDNWEEEEEEEDIYDGDEEEEEEEVRGGYKGEKLQ